MQQSRLLNIKKKASGNLVIRGTLILTITGFATRIIGFYNRIFLSHLIGAKELGIYQLIFPLYMVAFSLTTFGNELALTKLISEYHSRGDHGSAKNFFRVCFFLNIFLGMLTCIIMYKNAAFLCTRILNAPECKNCLKIISLGIPFMSAKGAIHGYFLGLERSGVHGISDFLEQLAKVFGLYLLASFICVQNSYDAAFAVWGIVIGEITAFLFSFFSLLIHLKKERRTQKFADRNLWNHAPITPRSIRSSTCLRLFLKQSVPLTVNRLALTVLQSIEAIIIPTVLLRYYRDSAASLAAYGIFSGMAFPFIMFPSTITNSLSTMLLPAVSSASSTLKTGYMKNLCEKSLHFCLLIGLFSMTVFYIFGPDIGLHLFASREAGRYLLMLSMLCPFIYLATTLASILNGLGFATHNLILTMLATIIRISFILVGVPRIGMPGYIAGLFVSYLFLTYACLYKLQKMVPVTLQFSKSILLPILLFIFTGSAGFICYQKLLAQTLVIFPPVIWLILVIALYGILVFVPAALLGLKKEQPSK